MLCALAPASLARMRFPLGELTKPAVRALAAEAELPVASKADSQDLCFLAGTGRAAFLARHGGARERPGEIVDRGGRVLGRHRGHHGFTVGQRKGIGVAAPEPLYVLATDARTNRVTVGARAELRDARGRRARRAAAPARRRGRRACACATARSRCRARSPSTGAGGSRCTSASRPTAPRRARPLVCTRATWSWATGRSRSAANVNGGWVGRVCGRAAAAWDFACRSNRLTGVPALRTLGRNRRLPRRLTPSYPAAVDVRRAPAPAPARPRSRAAARARRSARTPCRPRRGRRSRGAASAAAGPPGGA